MCYTRLNLSLGRWIDPHDEQRRIRKKFERKMEFLLNQQAKFDAEMNELKAAQAN